VIESATAGSTTKTFLLSCATGSMASATAELVPPTAMSAPSSLYASLSRLRPTSGLVWLSFSITTSLRPATSMVPPVA
jgi:hypothetical protein